MKKEIIDIPNKDLPIAKIIQEALGNCSPEDKKELLENMSEEEFVDHRVELFLKELEDALQSGKYSPAGAEEIAFKECMAGLPLS